MSSLKTYGRLDEAEQARLEARRKTSKRVAVISVSSLVLVAVIVAAVVGTTASNHRSSGPGPGDGAGLPLATSVKAVCDVTLYKDTCYGTLPPAVNSSAHVTPEYLLQVSIQVAHDELSKAAKYLSALPVAADNKSAAALANCRELIDTALDHLADSVSASGDSLTDVFDDLRTWLSAAGTCYDTCVDGLDNSEQHRNAVISHLKNSTEFTSNGLAIVTWISKLSGTLKLRRLMASNDEASPEWVEQRVLLESSEKLRKKADLVVAKDGNVKYKTIGEALKDVQNKNKKRTVIYVKRGVYKESVRVEKNKWNVLMVGDGMNETVVTGSLNFVDGTPTFSSATFAVFGKGFVGRDMGFRNTAGAIKHQAVALMASADQVVFHRCSMEGYQDTLYAHSNRQFYRDCNVYGTVDFIFGNAAAVLQNCRIMPQVPMPGQKNTLTAQGKSDPNQNTGLALHNCTVAPASPTNLSAASVQTFLGRPWKIYSTTVFARSYLGGLIDPAGWLPWTGNSAPDTIYYVEFDNSGPGSNTKNRIKWKGLKTKPGLKEVSKFSVKSFLQGNKWIPETGVPNKPGI